MTNMKVAVKDKIQNCRGDDKKQQICKEYEVKVISRIALLPGHAVEGCCGELENEHTIFYYRHRESNYEDVFSVGRNCAKSFLDILNQPMPPLVDPLQNIQIPGVPTTTGLGLPPNNSQPNSSNLSNTSIPAINSELYVAINLWCILKRQTPKYALQRILTSIQTTPNIAITEKEVFDFLKVLVAYNKTLNQMLTEARNRLPNIKIYSFPTLTAIAGKNWIDLP